jgi:hypothetical protein
MAALAAAGGERIIMFGKILRVITIIYALAGIAMLLMVPASMFGWFGVESDPLAVVPAYLLGMPWTAALTMLDGDQPWVAIAGCAAGIALNTAILLWLARKFN